MNFVFTGTYSKMKVISLMNNNMYMFGFCNRIYLPLVKIEYLDTQLVITIVYWLIVDRMIYLNIFFDRGDSKSKRQ